MTEHFHIPGRWDPGASPLAWAIQRLQEDRLRAETTFYVVAVAAVFGYLVLIFMGWAWLNWDGAPSSAAATRYWILQSLGLVAVIAVGWAGWRPSTRVTLSDDAVRISQGKGIDLVIPVADITELARIPAVKYHQHYRKYARTRAYPGPVADTVVLIRTASRPVILGIRAAEQRILLDRLGERVPARLHQDHRVA
ncbi:MAG: hypothetical protein ACI9W4_002037 [Rhodothermales bacterium]